MQVSKYIPPAATHLFQAVIIPVNTYIFQFGPPGAVDNWFYLSPGRRFTRGGFEGGLTVFETTKDLKLIDLTSPRAKALLWEFLSGHDSGSYSTALNHVLVTQSAKQLGTRYQGFLSCENDDGDSKELELVLFDTSHVKAALFENDLTSLVEWQWGLVDGVKAKNILMDKYDDCLAREYPGDPRVLLNPECVANILNEKLMRSLPDYQTRSW